MVRCRCSSFHWAVTLPTVTSDSVEKSTMTTVSPGLDVRPVAVGTAKSGSFRLSARVRGAESETEGQDGSRLSLRRNPAKALPFRRFDVRSGEPHEAE